jgi:hypothetical protein
MILKVDTSKESRRRAVWILSIKCQRIIIISWVRVVILNYTIDTNKHYFSNSGFVDKDIPENATSKSVALNLSNLLLQVN